jgi:hypothetical protein
LQRSVDRLNSLAPRKLLFRLIFNGAHNPDCDASGVFAYFAVHGVNAVMYHIDFEWREHQAKVGQLVRRATRLGLTVSVAAATYLLIGCSDKGDPGGSSAPVAEYALGTPVRFGADGNARGYQAAGWSSPEPDHTWTDGSTAVLRFKLKATDVPLRLRVRMSGLTKAPELPFQPVEVKVNGVHVTDWQVAGESDYSATIPAEAIKKEEVMAVQFSIPKATSPSALGTGADDRTLGLNVALLTISAAPQ